MRADALGLFWEDKPKERKAKQEVVKPTPPEPVWLRDDYLPGYEEAVRLRLDFMSDEEMLRASQARERLLFDIECYPNFFCASFRSATTGRAIIINNEEDEEQLDEYDRNKLRWILENFTTVGFNSLNYDLPITTLAIAGKRTELLKAASDLIVTQNFSARDVLRQYRVKPLQSIDHIDLIEVAPLFASLKIYGGRLHTPRMQDLPFPPDRVLNDAQKACVLWYNANSDLTSTGFLHESLKAEIDLRTQMSNEYGIDLRSKSDAQIAEAVIGHELRKLLGKKIDRPQIDPGTSFKYQVPSFIRYSTPLMKWALDVVANARFVVTDYGNAAMPKEIKDLCITIANSTYRMGIGGLHSSEKTCAHVADEEYEIIDKDVTSYYPSIILNLGLFPDHLGPSFLQVYRNIVSRRVAAKRAGDKVTANSLKITINGSFGKLGNAYSIFYSPHLLIQVTVTGQLSLLMLIERLELAGISVVSANTDGIVIKCKRSMRAQMDAIVKGWEQDTGFETEETLYSAIYSRDVNNYIAIKPDGTTKNKGAYANPWRNGSLSAECLHKNPTATICIDAVEQFLTKGTPIMTTVESCTDIRKFVHVRNVKGGAVKVWSRTPPPPHKSEAELIQMAGYVRFTDDTWVEPDDKLGRYAMNTERAYKKAWDALSTEGKTEYLGKSIRWYYAKGEKGAIVYANSGNKVPRTEGAMPLMDLPKEFPQDVDTNWYITECEKILTEIGYY